MQAATSEHWVKKIQWRKIDAFLLVTLFVGFLLCFHGSEWGRVESWNPDQMGIGKVASGSGDLFPRPQNFLKPSLHPYINYWFSWYPNKIVSKIFGYDDNIKDMYRMRTSRVITALMFLGTVLLSYLILREYFGLASARVTSALFASSAGYVAWSHYMTTDVPVLFWMMAAFFYATKILGRFSYRDYILAGLLTGLATATKYNGLAIGISFAVAHYLRLEPITLGDWWRASFNWPLVLGVCMVFVGFIFGNPHVIIDFGRFTSDFYYNYLPHRSTGANARGRALSDFY